MDWVKVAKALDDEWWSRHQLGERSTNAAEAERQRRLADLAFMLRDCLVAGMNAKDREKVFDRSHRKG